MRAPVNIIVDRHCRAAVTMPSRTRSRTPCLRAPSPPSIAKRWTLYYRVLKAQHTYNQDCCNHSTRHCMH